MRLVIDVWLFCRGLISAINGTGRFDALNLDLKMSICDSLSNCTDFWPDEQTPSLIGSFSSVSSCQESIVHLCQ